MKKIFLLVIVLCAVKLFAVSSADITEPVVVTDDGSWCWFADPRAVYYEGAKKQTYIAWVSSVGDIVVASYNHETSEYVENTIHARLEADDHDVPAILIRNDGRLVVFYSKHQSAGPMNRVISTNPEDISSFGAAYTFSGSASPNVSYPNPFQVGDSICVLYRDINWHPTIAVSTDNGEKFTDIRQLVLNGGARPYARYCQGTDGSIHVAVTTGHPRDESKNKIFYFCLKDNKFYRADGTLIKGFTKGIDLGDSSGSSSEAEIVYDGVLNGKGWIWDITIDPETNNPVMVYASFPKDDDHRYNYAYWDGEKWVNKEIVKSGKWFPQTPANTTEPEKNYSGGLSMDHENPSIVYLSKQVNDVFEIYKYETSNKGTTWTATAITENSPSGIVNARPIVPRNHKEGYFDVLWMRGTYEYYFKKYKTAIVGLLKDQPTVIEKIEINSPTLNLVVGATEQLSVRFYPSLVQNHTLTWSSSNENVATVTATGKVETLAAGKTTITATAFDGTTKDSYELTVIEPVCLKEAFFDFGTIDSPIAQGAIRVTGNTLLGESYGWSVVLMDRDRSGVSDDEKRDFVLGPNPTQFTVFIENGVYDVTVLQGDKEYMHDKMRIKVNDEVKVNEVSCAKGEYKTSAFVVEITDKQMVFEFSRHGNDANWVVNSIRIKKKADTASNIYMADDLFLHPETIVSVFDLSGKKLFEEKLNGRTYSEYISDKEISKGIYLVHLKRNEHEKALKIVY